MKRQTLMNGIFPYLARWIGIPFILLAGMRCAHVEAPSGGPVDATRPAVAAVYPAPGATRVPAEGRVIFQFSEWIDRGSNRGVVVVSPPYPGRVRVEVDGDKLIARPPAGMQWRKNETHVVTVLGTLKDLRGNPMGKRFDLRFSTGFSLDSAGVAGKLGREGQRGVLVAALYRMTGREEPDAVRALSPRDTGYGVTLQPEPARELPAYLAGADSAGAFRFDGVRAGEYALFAFEDLNGNFAFDAGLEAAAPGALSLGLRPQAPEQSLRLVPLDTMPLRMIDVAFAADSPDSAEAARATDTLTRTAPEPISGVILVKFSREPHPQRAAEASRYLVVSDAGETLAITDAAWAPEAEAWALQAPPLRANARYRVAVRARPDFKGREGADQPDTSVVFTVEAGQPAADWKIAPLASAGGFDGKPRASTVLAAGASQAFLSSFPLTARRWTMLERSLQGHVRFTDKDTVPVIVPMRLQRTNLASFVAQLAKPLRPGSTIELKIRPEIEKGDTAKTFVLFAGRVPDSTQTTRVKIDPHPGRADWSYWAQSTADAKLQMPLRRSLNDPSSDSLVSSPVPAGRYRVVAFRDTDGDGVWNPGSIRPWISQEPFEVVSDSVSAKH